MASDLVDLLHDATVTRGAQGIAYSCLLDVLSQRGQYAKVKTFLLQSFRITRSIGFSDARFQFFVGLVGRTVVQLPCSPGE